MYFRSCNAAMSKANCGNCTIKADKDRTLKLFSVYKCSDDELKEEIGAIMGKLITINDRFHLSPACAVTAGDLDFSTIVSSDACIDENLMLPWFEVFKKMI